MKVVVVGGGISGLSAAYDLARAEIACTLVEAQPRLGGVIRTERIEGCLVEAGPDSFLAQKTAAAELIRELGLGDQLIGSNDDRRKTYVVRGGRLIALPDGVQFMAPTKILPMVTTALLSPSAKVRMALEWFRRPMEREKDCSVAEFVLDHYGDEANEYLTQPMLAGVYGGSPESLSVKSVLPRFVELERRYGSLSRGMLAARRGAPNRSGPPAALFQTLKGGLEQLVDELAGRIRGRVETLHAEALNVRPLNGAWEVDLGERKLVADRVILTLPTYRAGALIEKTDPALGELLRSIAYHSSITGAFVYKRPEFARPLDGFGFLVPRAEKRLIAACTWVNTKFNHRAPDDRPLLRAFLAGEKAENHLASADEELVDRMHNELQELMGFDSAPAAARINRWPKAMAQYRVGHQDLVRRIEQRAEGHRGLYLGGNGFDGIGIPDCIRRSREIVKALTTGG